jgi:transcription elongation GreA/GreB family factor
MEINKKQLIDALCDRLKEELQTIAASADSAREAATHEQSIAEDAHDTRGLEASYLAGAQTARANELKQQILSLQYFPIRDYTDKDPIDISAVVSVLQDGKKLIFLLMPQHGGSVVKIGSLSVQILTPNSPVGEALMGRTQGDTFELEINSMTREYEIIQVR